MVGERVNGNTVSARLLRPRQLPRVMTGAGRTGDD